MKKKVLSVVVVLVCVGYYFDLPIVEIISRNIGRIAAAYPVAEGVEIPRTVSGDEGEVLTRMNYTVSFNTKMNIPNWVAWTITAEELIERESRSDNFMPDPALPEHMAVTTDDYTHSGYDRGHMCPAADNRYHWRAMDECFYMTNICPQNRNLNAGVWNTLEQQCRNWAEEGHTVHVVCGPIVSNKKRKNYIGSQHKVCVPDAFFKVVMYGFEEGRPQAVGFVFENKAGKKALEHYACTVDEVEEMTGLDFFYRLDDSVEIPLESMIMVL